MKRNFFFIFFLLHLVANGQSVAVYSGEKIEKKFGEFNLLSYDSTSLYVFRKTDGVSWRREYRLETYSRDSLKRLVSIKIPYPDIDSVKFELEDILIHTDYYQIIYSYYNSKHDQRKVNLINFSRTGEKIGETKTIDFSEGRNARKAGYYEVYEWKKKNEILSYGYKFINDTVYVNIDHFNYEGNKLRSQNFKHGEDFGYFMYGTIDSEGNLYYVTKERVERNSKEEDPIYASGDKENKEGRRSVKMYTPESDTAVVMPLHIGSSDGYLLSDRYDSFTDKNGIFNIVSTFSQSVYKDEAIGIYLVQVDVKKQALVREKFIPFNSPDNNLGANKTSFTLPHCIMTHLLDRPGGSMEIILENRKSVMETYYGIEVVTTYETGSIFSVTVDSNYTVSRMCRIKKQQYVTGKNQTYTGFVLLYDSARCFYLYNDLPENLNWSPGKDITKVKDSKLDETSIILTATEYNKINERKIILEKADPKEVDALLMNGYMNIGGKELYVLRRINKEDYLTKFYLK